VPTAIRRVTSRVAQTQPRVLRRLARPVTPGRSPVRRPMRRAIGGGAIGGGAIGARACPNCGRQHRFNFPGPVTLTVQGR